MITPKELYLNLHNQPDWINCKRYSNSLEKLLTRHNGIVPDTIIAGVLMITEEQIEELYNAVVAKLKKSLKVVDYE